MLKKIFFILLFLVSFIEAQETYPLLKFDGTNIIPIGAWNFQLGTSNTINWGSTSYLQVVGGQLQFKSGASWYPIPTSTTVGTMSFTHGVNKIYNTTVGDKFYFRLNAADTTATKNFNVKGSLQADTLYGDGSNITALPVAQIRTAISSTVTGLTYTNTTGVFSLTSGYVVPTTTEETNWNTAKTRTDNIVKDTTGWNTAKTRTDNIIKDTTNWNTAYTDAHTHANKAKLDSLAIAASALNALTSNLALKAPLANPTFTGTVNSVTLRGKNIEAGRGITSGIPFTVTNYAGTIKALVDSNGVLSYNFIHAIGSADSISYSVGGLQNTFYKINTGLITWRETDGITAAGDSLRILTGGDYKIIPIISITTSNANDKIRIKLYINGVSSSTSIGRWIVNSQGTGNGDARSYLWYRTFTANDWLSFRVENQSGARPLVISDFKVYIERIPEM